MTNEITPEQIAEWRAYRWLMSGPVWPFDLLDAYEATVADNAALLRTHGVAWVIERFDKISYWGRDSTDFNRGDGCCFWTPDSLAAMRFARKEDAELFIKYRRWEEVARPVEHMWVDTAQLHPGTALLAELDARAARVAELEAHREMDVCRRCDFAMGGDVCGPHRPYYESWKQRYAGRSSDPSDMLAERDALRARVAELEAANMAQTEMQKQPRTADPSDMRDLGGKR